MRKTCINVLIVGASMLIGVATAQPSATDPSTDTDQAPAQTPPAQTAAVAPTPPPAPKSAFTQGGMDFSFMFDGYVNGSYNHPDSGFNQLRNFDFRADTLHVNMGKITIDRAPAPVGFHLDVGFGQTFSVIHSTDRAPQAFKYFEQAYVSFKPKSWKGVQIDAGEFVTSAGAEVIETNGELELLPLAAVLVGDSLLPFRRARHRADREIHRQASRWCRAGTTSTTTTAGRPWASPAPTPGRK